MDAIIKRWGNSLGIRIPNLIVKELSLQDGSCVDISDEGNEIIIKPKSTNQLSQMLNLINDDNIHKEIEISAAMGAEIW